MTKRYILALLGLWCVLAGAGAQEFFDLTADEVRIDSTLPRFTHTVELGAQYADDYDVSIEYPEFIDMSATDVARYHRLRRDTVPAMPVIDRYVGVARRQGTLYLSFTPIVFREGRFQKLVSFRLHIEPSSEGSKTADAPLQRLPIVRRQQADSARYASHSVLSSGRWAKISVAETGIHQLTAEVVRRAGFSGIDKVRIFGYGGALQPELLTASYVQTTDDLQEVPTCTVGGRRLFWATGPVSWSSNTALARTRNPYSNYGYYFITEGDEKPLTVDSTAFMAMGYPSADDYHTLYETDNYAWYHGGRNLFESTPLTVASARSLTLPAYSEKGKLAVSLTYDGAFDLTVQVNGKTVGTMSYKGRLTDYNKAMLQTVNFSLDSLQSDNIVSLTQNSGSTVRLDYIALCSEQPKAAPNLMEGDFPAAQYVYNITNQDHHADGAADMVIIIPTSQKLLAQAERLKQLHEQKDGMRVRIVPADELYNEFSSGTPDANAYRRYLKMLYDRAATEADMPSYLLLFGDGAWDNRMLTSNWRNYSPDDFLLCYESENSLSEVSCYVTDDYFCLLDDGEGGNLLSKDKADVAVGRLTCRTAEEAKVLVDKILSYSNNEMAGAWQNTICFMADDGNGPDQNNHMRDAERILKEVQKSHPSLLVKKVYWDAYVRIATATGNTYPDASKLIKQQMQAGALIMDYQGHGSAAQISHEKVLERADFGVATSLRLPLWITASCDIMPFDSHEDNIGETAMLNSNGGAIAFFGTTRTVYQDMNLLINRAMMRNVLGTTNGRRNSIGEAVRLSKNGLIDASSSSGEQDHSINKLCYTLLGDPALVLALPEYEMVIDSINGKPAGSGTVQIPTGTRATLSGHIEGATDFNGTATVIVRDVEQDIVCKLNYVGSADTAFVFKDRPNTLYQGSAYVRNGRFNCSFAVSKDISFSEKTGQVLAYAVNDDKTMTASGKNENFRMVGTDNEQNDGIGPNIYCYLNSAAFVNGGTVNATPYFYAEVSDKDGVNVSGSGIGHNLELVVDGNVTQTYLLNDYFEYDFGDYRSGKVGYSLPALSDGEHRLTFRAWDVLNNSSVAELRFTVDAKQEPSLSGVICTANPARTSTSFIINHDRTGSLMDVALEIFDASGRKLWQHAESGVPTGQTYTVDWDLTTNSGSQLHTGVYLYRVRVACNGSQETTSAQKLIILRK